MTLPFILLGFAKTIREIPYEALGPEITDDDRERNDLFAKKALLELLGLLLGVAMTIMSANIFGPMFMSYPEGSTAGFAGDKEVDKCIYAKYKEYGLEPFDPASENSTQIIEIDQYCANVLKKEGFLGFSVFLAIGLALSCLLLVTKIRERPFNTLQAPPPLVPSLLSCLNNKRSSH